ncbi:hypothetical protein OIU76_003094 [Salix suchowensis]|nr:hypothetical protein OIU76_003094 [Salix suchowensis]
MSKDMRCELGITTSNMVQGLAPQAVKRRLLEWRQPLQLNPVAPSIDGIIRFDVHNRRIISAPSSPDPNPMRGHC